jgi:hypothetical protein
MLKRKQKTFMCRIGVLIAMIVMMLSGLAFAEDVPAPPRPSAVERSPNQELTVPESQECCWCAQNETAFDDMVAEACRTRYQNAGVDVPTEAQLNDCIAKLKEDVLKSCPKVDWDGDGILDYLDNCPEVPNPQQAQTDPNIKVNGKCRFINNGDGTVTDVPNRRVWLKNANPAGRRMTWVEANEYCQGLNIAGGGWRLPEDDEFGQLITEGELQPGHPFTNIQSSRYWTSVEGSFFHVTRRIELPASDGSPIRSYVWPVRNTTTN